MAESTTTMVPEQGQLVEVRQRRFVVNDVTKSTLPRSALTTLDDEPQHLVSLTSVDDDGQGEELQVIWELEPGARAFDPMALPQPTGFDAPQRLDAFLNAVRWGAATSADVRALQAPFRSGIDIEDYQLDPLVRSLQIPRVNLLIADDVGLGKTIEAGLVVQELLIRHRARRILIVCPASLQIQWRDQMQEKFGLAFRIVDSTLMKELRRERGIHVNPWTHFPRLITSIDYLKRERPMRFFREVLPAEGESAYPRRFDLIIIDEAHNVAPAGRGRYAVDSQRTGAIRTLAPHFEHKLFLTATPHNGYAESFSALLELLDNQRFARGIPPDRDVLQSVMVRRLKAELPPNWDGTPRFPQRQLEAIEVAYSDDERAAHESLQSYTKLRQAKSTDFRQRTSTEFVLKLLKKRLFSSPAAFAITLEQHRKTMAGKGRDEPQKVERKPPLGILRSMIDSAEEEFGDDDAFDDANVSALYTTTQLLQPLGTEEEALLDVLQQWAQRASARPDSKAETLISWLHQHIKPDGEWSDERVIIFTEYRDTQKWLQTLLAAEGLTQNGRMMVLYGGMDIDERGRIKAAFQANPAASPVRILLATDAASEGIDLQLHCHRVIHYEIPWNPNRMEQRNGRIDRHGQRYEPLIHHFAPQGYQLLDSLVDVPVGALEGDLEFLRRAVLKVEQIREDLGKVGPVIAEQVREAMLGQRQRLSTEEAERAAQPARKMLKFERDLNERIKKLHEQLQENRRTLELTPENVQAAVEIALELAGQPPLQPAEVDGIWPDSTDSRQQCPVFCLPPMRGSWKRAAEGLEHPHSGEIRPIVFDHNLARGRDDVVIAHLNHPLVQMSLRLLRAEVWRADGADSARSLHRVTARTVPDNVADTPLVIAHARLVMIGQEGHRLHEELLEVGGEIREGRFRRLGVTRVRNLLTAAKNEAPSQAVQQQLLRVWPAIEQSLQRALAVRESERTERKLAERAQKETDDITAILQELEQNIRAELEEEPEFVQLDLISPSEREQYSRSVVPLRAHLAQIPEEIERETEAIRARYADPQPRLFPVALTFLISERLTY